MAHTIMEVKSQDLQAGDEGIVLVPVGRLENQHRVNVLAQG